MKPSKIIALIVAVAIGLVIAFQLTNKEATQSESVTNTQAELTQQSRTTSETVTEKTTEKTEPASTTISNSLKLNNSTDQNNNTNLNTSDDVTTTEAQKTTTQENKVPMITFKTNKGDIEITLDAEKAPVSAANFIKYAKSGQYEGTIFHRVIPGFMIQGGGFEPGMKQKEVGAPIPNEANNGLKNNKYTIAMARTSDPHSATAQFFINAKDNDFLNFSSETSNGWGYAVFGEVINGKDVVDAIEGVATSRSGHHGDVPVEDIIVESVIVSE